MSIKISGTDVVDDNRKGIFTKVNAGVYSTSQRNALSASTGDMIYNSTDQEVQAWTGSEWVRVGEDPVSAPRPYGEISYTAAGNYTFVAPADAAATGVSIVLVAAGQNGQQNGGAGGGGGALAYGNSIPVVAGTPYPVTVGNSLPGAQTTTFASPTNPNILQATAGSSGGSVSGSNLTAGNSGGNAGPYSSGYFCDGAGGAGGYSGKGGSGGGGTPLPGWPQGSGSPAETGSGGGGGGGGGPAPSDTTSRGGFGGGVGLKGRGIDGARGTVCGSNGSSGSPPGPFHGGGAGSTRYPPAPGGMPGGVRIVWGGPPAGTDRQFPTTNVS